MNDRELGDTVRQIQVIVCAETGTRPGTFGEKSLPKILCNVASHIVSGTGGLAARMLIHESENP